MIDYISQTPLIPVVLTALVSFLVLMQCLTKRKFLKVRLLFSFILTFLSVLVLVFFKEIQANKEIYLTLTYLGLILIELVSLGLLFTSFDFSMSSESFQKNLTKSLDETKLYAFLDRKDRVKRLSTCFLNYLEVEESEILGKNFFDVVERKFLIVGLNSESSTRKEVKDFFKNYDKKAVDQPGTLELNLEDDNAEEYALYFVENPVFASGKYRGRILMGEAKNEESLMGMEKELADTQNEFEIVREKFTTILMKTNDGLFFTNYENNSIWLNDILVEKLFLNGNSLSISDFYHNMNPDDVALYQNTVHNMKNNEYEVTYRYNNGSYEVYVKESGRKITVNGVTEIAGVMNVIDDNRFEKTNTALDAIGTESEMQIKYKELLSIENNVFMVVYFKISSIPDINDHFGRAVGNMMMSEYIAFFKKNFVTNNYLYRVSGLEFVAFITNYNRMEALKSGLKNDEKILHIPANYASEKIMTEVSMGISYSNDTAARKDTLKNAKDALRISSNPQYRSSYAFFRDVK